MIKLLGKLPDGQFFVALSGGVDSMAAYHFIKTGMNGKRQVKGLFFDHGTKTSASAYEFLKKQNIEFELAQIGMNRPLKLKGQSQEEYWRQERYHIFTEVYKDFPIITAHHLDDQVETWLMSAMHGQPKLIPYRNRNVVRPFMLNTKSEMLSWALQHKIEWIEDDSNMDYAHARNRVRHEIIPEAMLINPGIHKVIAKKVRLLTSGEK